MKKNYFSILFAALMLFVAMPAKAQVESMTDLFGKYKLTATIETTDAGKAHADLWKSECEVIITKGENGAPAAVTGLFGATESQTISSIDIENNKFYSINPNPNFGLFSQNPYIGVADMTLEDLQMYTMEYHYNPETKEITIPDFSICEFSWTGGVMAAVVLAEVSNVKMELLEAEEIVIPEIEGEWSYKPYNMGYVSNDSTFVYEFKMNLVAKDDTKTLYDATFNFEGFDEFTLEATFNGNDLIIPFDSTYLDAENKIRFGIKATKSTPENVFVKKGQLSFSYSSKTLMWQGDYIYIRQEGVDTLGNEVAPLVQQLSYGWIEREDPNAYDWSGEYTVNVKDIECFNDTIEFPSTFNMVIEKSFDSYTVIEFAGYKSDYYPSIELIPGEDGKTATLDLAGYYGFAMLASPTTVTVEGEEDRAYDILTDLNGQSTSLTFALNEDGSVSIDDFSVSVLYYYSDKRQVLGMLSGVTASKVVYEWAGEYTLTATVEEFDTTKCASEFDVKIKKFNDAYYITQFDGDKVYSLNYGGIEVEVTGNNSAKIASGCLVNGTYPVYITLDGVDNAAIEMTMDNAGNIKMADFLFHPYNYETYATGNPIAKYTNVVLTRKTVDAGIENMVTVNKTVEGIFDLMGRKHNTITTPGIYIVNGKKVVVK